MTAEFTSEAPWVLFKLNHQVMAIPASNIQEMITIPEVTPVPRSPEFVRGVINMRGAVIALVDMRLKLNQPTLQQEIEELVAKLDKLRDDHLNWLDELEKTVKEDIDFSQARDPRQCDFGKWYYSYDPKDARISDLLAAFEQPHQAVHATAEQVEALLHKGDRQGAQQALDKLRATHMARFVHQFETLKQGLRVVSREIAIVVEYNDTVLAFTVDSVEAVETLQANSIENLPGNMTPENNYIVTMLGKRSADNSPVLIPDLSKIITGQEMKWETPPAALETN